MTRKLARRALRAMKRSIDHQQRAIVNRTEAVMREEAKPRSNITSKPTTITITSDDGMMTQVQVRDLIAKINAEARKKP